VVTSPQELVSMIVEKAVKMAKLMEIPILGIVENMSYVECPNCAEKINIFGESHMEEIAKNAGVEALGRIPMRPDIAANCDKGRVEDIDSSQWLGKAIDTIKNTIKS
jgi:Mrp family chromosome partitioning ATPase